MTRGLMIAAPRSGSGKTTVTLGLLRTFRRRGVATVGLKSGPDYIDPAFHAAALAARASTSIPGRWRPTFFGARGRRDRAATWRSARPRWACSTGFRPRSGAAGHPQTSRRRLAFRSLLVIDVSGQAQSAAAIVKGCMTYDERLSIAGVVVNRVGSERHRRLVSGRSKRWASRSSALCRATMASRCPSAIWVSCRRRKRRRSTRGSTRSPISSRRMSTAPAFSALRRDLPPEAARREPVAAAARGSASRSRAMRPSPSSIPISSGAGGRQERKSSPFRRLPTSRRLPIATPAGCRAAIRNCTRAGLRGGGLSRWPASLRRNAPDSWRVRGLYGARRKD